MPEEILVAEHDDHLREAIRFRLSVEGYSTVCVADGGSAVQLANARHFDLIVMDVTIPPAGALQLSAMLRSQPTHRRTPIVIVTTPSRESEALQALEQCCADNYVVKPFGLREFVARVRELIRRSGSRRPEGSVTSHPLTPALVRSHLVIDHARRRVDIDGQPLRLTEQEFQLLYLLVSHQGVVFDRDTLLSEIWGDQTFVTFRSVDALVKRLRKRLKTAGEQAPRVVTVRGVGYKFE